MKYKVAVSGWAVVEVIANSPSEAMQIVAEEHSGISGELYDLEVHGAVASDDDFVMHTDLN